MSNAIFAMRDRFVEAILFYQSRGQIDVSRDQFRLDLHGPLGIRRPLCRVGRASNRQNRDYVAIFASSPARRFAV